MTTKSARFGAIAQALKDRTASAIPGPLPTDGDVAVDRPAAVPTAHKPALALNGFAEGLRERILRFEAELAEANGRNDGLERELALARSAAKRAGMQVDEFLFLDPDVIRDELPRDRLTQGFSDEKLKELFADIDANGQNDAITVRPALDGKGFEIAAGRRRLEVCRRLGRQVLARVRTLDDSAMFRVQYSENERREDISALERARWFADVKTRLNVQAKDIATQFGLDPSTLSLYLRLARFPDEILSRLRDPRRLSVLRARRVMEALEDDPNVLARILEALDHHARDSHDGMPDADAQIDTLIAIIDGKSRKRTIERAPVPERRHIVHRGRRVGTLTRNGGQWVFRFATSLSEDVIQAIADRLSDIVDELEVTDKKSVT